MKLSALDFTTSNNAALSLKVLAEMVRAGDAHVSANPTKGGGLMLGVWDKDTVADLGEARNNKLEKFNK